MDPQEAKPAPEQEEYSPQTKVGNSLTVTQPGEQTICEIKRHQVGIIGIYITSALLLMIVAVLAFIVLPHVVSGGKAIGIGIAFFLLVTVFDLIFVFISTKVYNGNSWVVTTDSLTQIEQKSLFNRDSSQLSLGNLEDVTAEQKGVLAHMLNYGWIRVETAGERSKFIFPYCPNPNYYAQQILAARENFEQHRSSEDNNQRTYRSQGAYAKNPQEEQPTQPPVEQAEPAGYGSLKQPVSQPTDSPDSSTEEYPSDSDDQGINVND